MTLAILLFAAIWIGAKVFSSPIKVAAHSDFRSMMMASNLLDHGVFSSQRSLKSGATARATCDNPPGYPLVLATLGAINQTFADALRCFGKNRLKCQSTFRFLPLIVAQYVLALAAILLAFLAVWQISGSLPMAALTVLLLSLFGKFDTFSEVVRPEGYLFVFVFAAIFCSVLALKFSSWVAAFLMQAFYAIAALFNPAYIVAALTAAIIVFLSLRKSTEVAENRKLPMALATGLGLALAILPWMTSQFSGGSGYLCANSYVAHLFAQRLAYNEMGWATFGATFILWLPGFGDGLASILFSDATLKPLLIASPESFLRYGDQVLWPMALKASNGSISLASAWLWENRFVPDALWHALTTLPLTLRGIFGAADLLAVAGIFLIPQFFATGRDRGDLSKRMLFVVPVLVTVVFLGAVTPNQYWHCLPVVLVFAYIVSDRFGAL